MIRPLATSETRRSFSLPKFGAVCATVLLLTAGLCGQLLGSGGNLQGRVEDPSGAALVGASVELRNSVAAYDRWASSDQNGEFHFDNIPFNTYELIMNSPGFQLLQRLVAVRSSLPQHLDLVIISPVLIRFPISPQPSARRAGSHPRGFAATFLIPMALTT